MMRTTLWKLSWNHWNGFKFSSPKAHCREVKIYGIGTEQIRGGITFVPVMKHTCPITLLVGCVRT